MNRIAMALLIGWLIGDRIRLQRAFHRLEAFAVKGQLRNLDQFNRIEQRLPTLKSDTFENRFTKPVFPADLWRQD